MAEQSLTVQQTKADIRTVQAKELKTPLGFMKALFRRTMADKVPVLAAALSFFTMLSIVPVLLLALAILGFVIYQAGDSLQQAAALAVSQMEKGIDKVLPGASVQQTFRNLAEQINLKDSIVNLIEARGIALATGLLSLIWASLQIFVNSSGLMNLAFDVEETRSWVKLRLVALGVTVGAALLFLLSLVPTSGPDFVRNLNIPWLGLPNPTPFWVDVVFALIALAVNVAMFTFIYRFLPNTRVEWKDALAGGLSMAILWEIAKKGFTLFLAGSDNPMYGAMGGVILLITWMYYTNILLLLGAEVSGLYRKVRVGGEVLDPMEQHHQELQAVHAGQAVPIAALSRQGDKDVPLAESKKRLNETMGRIRGNIHEVGESVKSTVHSVKTTPARHNASRAFEEPASAEERREMEVAPTAAERRPPRKRPRTVAGALGGATPGAPVNAETVDPEADARRREYRIIEERAARDLREGDFPPADQSKQRARETVNDIKEHIQSISHSVKSAKNETADPDRP